MHLLPSRTAPGAAALGPREPTRANSAIFAAIDAGSNAIRLLVAETDRAGQVRPLQQERAAVRLGREVFRSGRLGVDAMDDAIREIAGFRDIMERLGARAYRAVATSAVRDSSNGATLVERLRREAGIVLEPVSGHEEAALAFRAIRARVPLGAEPWILVDLGGGSIEISIVDEAGIRATESHPVGSVRLLQLLPDQADSPRRFRSRLDEYVAELPAPGPGVFGGMIATGGSMETLALLADPAGVGSDEPRTVELDELQALIRTLEQLSPRQRIDELGLREDRADVILPAAVIYAGLARRVGATRIVVPFAGVREGVILSLADEFFAAGPSAMGREVGA